jgi:hypothetical protein
MIHYDLRCPNGHVFEGWFRSSSDFDAQAAQGLVSCPTCQDTGIERALMAPSVAKKGNTLPDMPPEVAVKQALRSLRRMVESNFENVGDRFAEEARKIHYGETATRGIFGDTTKEEAEALVDEGIAFGQIPWVPETDS